jgi:hypothetical protein
MHGQKAIRIILFLAFFSIGAAALGGSVLCDDLVRYFQNKQFLEGAQRSLDRLKSLNADYDALLSRLQEDPNLVKRIAPATLGAEHEEPNAIYPRATAAQLAIARKALAKVTGPDPTAPAMPEWLVRCREPRRRTTLFIAGTSLVLVSLLCFGPLKPTPKPDA